MAKSHSKGSANPTGGKFHLLASQQVLRRLPEKKIPDCAGFLIGFKARQQAHSALCNGWGNAEAGQKDQQDGILFDRNRLSQPCATGGLPYPVRITSDLVDMSTFWHHSVFCALIARLLGKRCNTPHTERLFGAGLLHDVGQLVIYHELPELARQALASAEPSDDGLYRAEKSVLGFTHGDVGAALFKAWGLPDSLQAAARFHHEPSAANDFAFEAAIVHLANSAANAIEPARNILACRPERDPEAWQLTGLSEEALNEVVPEAEVQFLEVIRIISPHAPLI